MLFIRFFNKAFLKIRAVVLQLFSTKFNGSLVIFDDFFPSPYSDWRKNEILFYLQNVDNSIVFIGRHLNDKIFYPSGLDQNIKDFLNQNPSLESSIKKIKLGQDIKAKLGYCIFLGNIIHSIGYFKKNSIPFVFTLYPGGGFKMFDENVEQCLNEIFNCHLFRHVFVNMPHVYDYIKDKFKLNEGQISYIYGAPITLFPNSELKKSICSKIRVVFSSHKYSRYGIDKGLDIFVRVAKSLEYNDRFTFTVIGGFVEKDLVVKSSNIILKNEIIPENLNHEFSNYDIIVSPNRSHVLGLGSFDGFPTATVLHAANSGCMMMLTDEWNNSSKIGLVDNVDFSLIAPNADLIVSKLIYFYENRTEIGRIALNGKMKLNSLLDLEKQLPRRLEILNKYL